MLQSDDTPVEAGQASESPSSSSQRHSPCPEDVVRATSPPGRRYLKPVNGIQVKGFARSAQRRSSVVTLGSIERLQHFYAKKDLVINKIGTLGFKKGEPLPEEDEEDDWTVDAKEPPPLWKDWDVETNLDALLATCFQDIQHALAVWALVTGPNSSMSTVSLDSESSSSSSCSTRSDLGMVPSFPVLPLVESVTKMIRSVKTYSLYRHDLPLDKLSRLRQASLALLSTIKDMEDRYRKGSSQDHPSQGDQDAATKPTGKSSPTQSEPGFLYQPPYFDHLGDERQAILDYLAVVEKNVLTPSHRRHHLAARRRQTSFTQEIRDLIISASASEASSSDGEVDDDEVSLHASTTPSISWFTPGCYEDDALGRYHAFLTDHYSEPIPSPHEDEDLFWEALTTGVVLCQVYNEVARRSDRPFGFIHKIHQDTQRLYRSIENLNFFAAACKFRFELVFQPFDSVQIAKKTDIGMTMLKACLQRFCDKVRDELNQPTEAPCFTTSLQAS